VNLTPHQRDRAVGILVGTAAGDALGAGYEFGPPLPAGAPVNMMGGGAFNWAPGEWTDDTSMAIVIARVAARADLRSDAALDRIAAGWAAWACTAKDVGSQTKAVLSAATRDGVITGASLRAAAHAHHEQTGRSGGNGALMRTAPVALAYLDDEDALIEAATTIAALTHHDPEAGEACVLWCLAIRHAVLTGELDLRRGLVHLPTERAAVWGRCLDEAETRTPAEFTNNGWVVEALQAAWSAVARTPVPTADVAVGTCPAQHLRQALENAVRGGRDADTVAAIAGSLLGALWGASAVPDDWRAILHGWPGLRADDLAGLAEQILG
jgi:ADP-ribosylglycohydrolase